MGLGGWFAILGMGGLATIGYLLVLLIQADKLMILVIVLGILALVALGLLAVVVWERLLLRSAGHVLKWRDARQRRPSRRSQEDYEQAAVLWLIGIGVATAGLWWLASTNWHFRIDFNRQELVDGTVEFAKSLGLVVLLGGASWAAFLAFLFGLLLVSQMIRGGWDRFPEAWRERGRRAGGPLGRVAIGLYVFGPLVAFGGWILLQLALQAGTDILTRVH